MERIKEKMVYPDCAPEQCFWTPDGQILKNVAELRAALKKMSKGTFQHHVNKDKNDFARWIGEVFGDAKLAENIRKATSKAAIIKALGK